MRFPKIALASAVVMLAAACGSGDGNSSGETPDSLTVWVMGTSQDEDLVILWAFGGAASIEQAGYVPLPDDEEKVQ